MRISDWSSDVCSSDLRCCPFCGRHIGQLALFTDETEIEHIIPYSRSFDDSAANKVVAHRSCNREKRNMTPWEAWGHTERWAIIAEQVSRLHKSKQWRFGPDAMERFETDGGFLAPHLTDIQYLSRLRSEESSAGKEFVSTVMFRGGRDN